MAHLGDQPADPCAGRSDAPAGLGDVVLRMLAKEPSRTPTLRDGLCRDVDRRRAFWLGSRHGPPRHHLGPARRPPRRGGPRSWSFGRENVDVEIEDAELSRRHFAVRPVEGGLEVEDLGSRNGTRVDGTRIDSPTRVAPRRRGEGRHDDDDRRAAAGGARLDAGETRAHVSEGTVLGRAARAAAAPPSGPQPAGSGTGGLRARDRLGGAVDQPAVRPLPGDHEPAPPQGRDAALGPAGADLPGVAGTAAGLIIYFASMGRPLRVRRRRGRSRRPAPRARRSPAARGWPSSSPGRRAGARARARRSRRGRRGACSPVTASVKVGRDSGIANDGVARTALGWRWTSCGVRTCITVTPISSSSCGPISARPWSSLSLMKVPLVEPMSSTRAPWAVGSIRAWRREACESSITRSAVLSRPITTALIDGELPAGAGPLHNFEHQCHGWRDPNPQRGVPVKCPRADRRPGSWRRAPRHATACCRSGRCRRRRRGSSPSARSSLT